MFHTSRAVLGRKKGPPGDSSKSSSDDLDEESLPKPHVSMTESDKPDMMDLVSNEERKKGIHHTRPHQT